MTTDTIQLQDVDLWEAWIEYDQFNPTHFGTLYILGEIMIESGSAGPLITKGYDSEAQLVLNVPPRPHGRSRMKEVLYSEPVKSLDQYHTIRIYAGGALIARLDEIEVLV
jgi:hypothetical protein